MVVFISNAVAIQHQQCCIFQAICYPVIKSALVLILQYTKEVKTEPEVRESTSKT